MTKIDEDFLLKALDNNNNNSIVKLTRQKIKTAKNDILQQLQFPKEKLKIMHEKLKEYRYVDEIKDINYGCFLRWINLKDIENLNLTNGAYLCDIIINETGVNLKFRSFGSRYFCINMNLDDINKEN